ncbi:hypothetical protein [Gordonia rhizosphera]|uniref:Mce-associated membrane protein n=1 Tax=Gordonia rhizosphera NBRC 16068 TaxID=1108045 RepID=K6W9V7_9ACTN|nr:hypothetical protein [Gordonia rhizosphera]GAB88997.1 hypothetical protein GORHZ_047_00130 [Gordonia rhizosphera NBRC 16068]
MANPRPPRRRPTPRVAGRPRPTSTPTDGTPNPADSTPNPADGTLDLADGTPDLADGTQVPADSTLDPADSTQKTADGNHNPADDTQARKPAGKTRPVARVSTLRPAADASTTRPAASAEGRARTPEPTGPLRFRRRTLVVLVAVAAALGVFALIAALHPGATIGPNKAFVDRAATTELTSQVSSKACALTVDTVDVDKWANKARTVLTGKALDEFDKYLPQQREILNQTKAVADCRVESVGVVDLSGGDDGSTARVVVNMIVSQQQAGLAGQSAAPRYQFGMTKHGDDWLISEVEAF